MSTSAEIYRTLATAFTTVVQAVPDRAWDNPSPCQDWTARQVLQHVVDAERDSVKPGGLEPLRGPSSEADPWAAWTDVRTQLQAILDDPATAGIAFDGFFGPTTIGQAIEDYYAFDLIVHRWDIAQATGGDTTISADEMDFVRAKLDIYGDAMRMPGVFGEAIEPPADADEQTQLLAFMGRRAA